jgi:hypothetical protein
MGGDARRDCDFERRSVAVRSDNRACAWRRGVDIRRLVVTLQPMRGRHQPAVFHCNRKLEITEDAAEGVRRVTEVPGDHRPVSRSGLDGMVTENEQQLPMARADRSARGDGNDQAPSPAPQKSNDVIACNAGITVRKEFAAVPSQLLDTPLGNAVAAARRGEAGCGRN